MTASGNDAMQKGRAEEQRNLNWDASQLRTHHALIATASATPSEVLLNVGTTLSDRPDGVTGIRLLARIAMSPTTAKRLHDMLGKLMPMQDLYPPRPAEKA